MRVREASSRLFVWFILVSFAAMAVASDFPSPLRPAAGPVVKGTTPLVFDEGAYAVLKHAPDRTLRLTGFPLSAGRSVNLDLERFTVFGANSRVVLGSSDGDTPLPTPDVVLLRGQVVGAQDSEVFLGLSPEVCNGWVRMADTRYVISAGRKPANRSLHVYDESQVVRDPFWRSDFVCDVESIPQPPPEGNDVIAADGPQQRAAAIAVETDYEFTNNLFGGSTAAAGAYVATLFGAVDTIYYRDVETRMVVTYLRLWTSSNDPWNQGNTSNQLNQFRSYWNTNMTAVKRTIAHFLSGRALGGGVAWVAVLCNYDSGYGLSANLNGSFPPGLEPDPGNWDPFVVCHEIGHNFGTYHTHDGYIPPIDTCGLGCNDPPFDGTIMSYCHICPGGMSNIHLNFHPRVIEVIDAYLSGSARTCVTSARITGVIDLEHFEGDKWINGTVRFRYPGTQDVVAVRSILRQVDGTYGIISSPVGEWDILFEMGNWLHKVVPSVLIAPPEGELNVALINGDANGDNSVDLLDVNTVLANFGGTGGAGDLNRDNTVDLDDLNITLSNYGLQGDE